MVPPIVDSDAEASAVGYFFLPDDAELLRAAEIAAQMRRVGIRWVRLAYRWYTDGRVERPDTDDPAWLDSSRFERWVDAFRANGIEVLGVLFGVARWASSEASNEAIESDMGLPRWALVRPRDAEWETFVRTLAGRLHARVRSWEVWNEPDGFAFWQSSAADFVALTRSTAVALRDVDPGTRVVVNLVDQTDDSRAFQDTLVAGAGTLIDVFGLHYGSLTTVDRAREVLPRLRPGAMLWNTEAYGAPRLISDWLEQRAVGFERLFPYIYHTRYAETVVKSGQFGFYPVNRDYTPRPDVIALRTLSDQVGSLSVVGRVPGGRHAIYVFRGPSGPVLAVADREGLAPTWSARRAHRSVRLELPHRTRRVVETDLMGNHRVHVVRGGRLRLRLRGVATFLTGIDPDDLDETQLLPGPGPAAEGGRSPFVLRARREVVRIRHGKGGDISGTNGETIRD